MDKRHVLGAGLALAVMAAASSRAVAFEDSSQDGTATQAVRYCWGPASKSDIRKYPFPIAGYRLCFHADTKGELRIQFQEPIGCRVVLVRVEGRHVLFSYDGKDADFELLGPRKARMSVDNGKTHCELVARAWDGYVGPCI